MFVFPATGIVCEGTIVRKIRIIQYAPEVAEGVYFCFFLLFLQGASPWKNCGGRSRDFFPLAKKELAQTGSAAYLTAVWSPI